MLLGIERDGCAEMLNQLTDEELSALKDTVTQRSLDSNSREDARDAILTYSKNAEEFLCRQKLRRGIILRYLMQYHVALDPKATKPILVKEVLKYWAVEAGISHKIPYNETAVLKDDPNIYCATTSARHPLKSENGCQTKIPLSVRKSSCKIENKTDVETKVACANVGLDLERFSKEFLQWIFQLINSQHPNCTAPMVLTPDLFWPDVELLLHVGGLCRSVESSSGSQAVVEMERYRGGSNGRDYSMEQYSGVETVIHRLKQLVQERGLAFNPNSHSKEAYVDQHGLVAVCSAGTIHTKELCVGAFRLSVGVISDAFCKGVWKMKFLHLWLGTAGGMNGCNEMVNSEDSHLGLAMLKKPAIQGNDGVEMMDLG
uniref:Chromosome 3 open reading frame 38 n=1 Tax=Eptatretus burgeri TaxID=7764 RepID=A0A8C4WTL9_EPTBU